MKIFINLAFAFGLLFTNGVSASNVEGTPPEALIDIEEVHRLLPGFLAQECIDDRKPEELVDMQKALRLLPSFLVLEGDPDEQVVQLSKKSNCDGCSNKETCQKSAAKKPLEESN